MYMYMYVHLHVHVHVLRSHHLLCFSFTGSSDELSFKEGTLIMLISRVGGDEWLRGMTLKGEEGIFPKSFVEVVVSNNVTCTL